MTLKFFTNVDRPTDYVGARSDMLLQCSSALSDGTFSTNWKVAEWINCFHIACHGRGIWGGKRSPWDVQKARDDLLGQWGLVVTGEPDEQEAEECRHD